MGRFIRRHKEMLLGVILLLFLLSLFVGFGSIVADRRNLVAKVGSSPIKRKPFDMLYRQTLESLRNSNPETVINAEMERQLQNEILREMVIRELFVLEAKEWGIRVTEAEVANDIAGRSLFHKDGRFDPTLYYQFVVRTLGVFPKEFEAERSKDIANNKIRGLLGYAASPVVPSEFFWIYSAEHPGDQLKDEDRPRLFQAMTQQKSLDLLNQFLAQVSQKHPIQAYLNNPS